MVDYMMATGNEVHFHPPDGYVVLYMSPQLFLELTPSMQLDVEDSEYIQEYCAHIEDGRPLDGLELHGFDDKRLKYDHDGRHRAAAAMLAECEIVPVWVRPEEVDWLKMVGGIYDQAVIEP